jgi:signal transduction histidine kinase
MAIGIIYFYVAPGLEDQLVEQKLERLADEAKRESGGLGRIVTSNVPEDLENAASTAAQRSNAEVTLLRVTQGDPVQTLQVADSTPNEPPLVVVSAIAGEVVDSGKPVAWTESADLGRMAVAAHPIVRRDRLRGVAVFVAPLSDVEANVELIRGRIIAAGALALILAAVAGYLMARALAARVKRLETAARKVAAGDFSNPIHSDSDDELGQLAVAFDDMQRQLARLDTARKQFIASASHELRTPIFSLGGFLELLEDEELDEETRAQFLTQLRGQVARMRKLATELLDLSRLESGALELRPEPTDVGQLARDVAEEFTPAISAHDAELEVHAADDPIEIECDPERVAQVMRILLDNALVHTPAGTTIVVSAARDDGHVTLEVADTGLGIRHQTMPHIFEPFFTSADGARGAGLGLAIARELAGQMRGQLSVRSAPGETSFKLTLPA